jgi:hypothetical protein
VEVEVEVEVGERGVEYVGFSNTGAYTPFGVSVYSSI